MKRPAPANFGNEEVPANHNGFKPGTFTMHLGGTPTQLRQIVNRVRINPGLAP